MSDNAEIKRFRQQDLESPLPAARHDFLLKLREDPDGTWQRIRSVVEIIVEQDEARWPGDGWWKARLPPWMSSFLMTSEECDVAMARTPRERWDSLPWEFSSWLDAIRERDWRWWGGMRTGDKAQVVVEVTGIPPRIDAFKQILLAAGAQILSEVYD